MLFICKIFHYSKYSSYFTKKTFKIYFYTYVAIPGKTWAKSFSFALYRFVWKQLLVIIFSNFKTVEILISHFVSIENKRNHRYDDQ